MAAKGDAERIGPHSSTTIHINFGAMCFARRAMAMVEDALERGSNRSKAAVHRGGMVGMRATYVDSLASTTVSTT